MRTDEPMVHTVSICPLSQVERRDLDCRTTGFVGPRQVQMFVSPGNVFLWNSAADQSLSYRFDDCAQDGKMPPRARAADVAPGVVFRVPVGGGEPDLLAVRGEVTNQFSMDQYRGRFRALVRWQSQKCDQNWEDPIDLALLDVPLTRFGPAYDPGEGPAFTPVPAPGKRMVENRFVDDWLVYGGRDGWRSYPPDAEDGPQSARAVAVPLRNPQAAQVLEPGHEFVRIERVGNDVMMSGYRDPTGLHVSLIKLAGRASIGGQAYLRGRFESEGRSHAFNSMVQADGSGLMGVPTVRREEESGRWVWRSNASDISYLSLDGTGTLHDLGSIDGISQEEVAAHAGYLCEVSCIDWYGNSRPIFTLDRVFAVMGTALVEVELVDGRVREKHRIDLTAPIRRN